MAFEGIDPRIRQFADTFEPEIQRQFMEAVREVRRWVPMQELAEALDAGKQKEVIELIVMVARERLGFELAPMAKTLNTIGLVGAGGLQTSFDLSSDAVMAHILNRTNTFITKTVAGIQTTTTRVVQDILFGGYLAGMHPFVQARLIRQQVGLLPQHYDAWQRYVGGLHDEGFPDDQIERLGDLYSNRLLNYRAKMIARTETITAEVSGRYREWMSRVESGLIQWGRTWVEWRVTVDDRLCPWCAPMQGKRVRLGEPFISDTKGFPDVGIYRESDKKVVVYGEGTNTLTREYVAAPVVKPLRPDPFSVPRGRLGQFISKAVKSKKRNGETIKARTVLHPPLHPGCRCDLVLHFDL